MQIKVVEKLKTLSVSNVVYFGTAALPAPPYTVVKTENNETTGCIDYRIIGHFAPDQQLFLEDYMKLEVYAALNKFEAIDRHGHTNMLKATDWTDIAATSDDGTISMEITFSMPIVPIIQY